jgi:hypothetical protein
MVQVRITTTLDGSRFDEERVEQLLSWLTAHAAGLGPVVAQAGDRDVSVVLAMDAPTVHVAAVRSDDTLSSALDDILGVGALELVTKIEAERVTQPR